MSSRQVGQLFTPAKYKKNEVGEGENKKEVFFADGSDSLANRNFKITITHVPSGRSIDFKAFIMTFNDTYSQDWNSEQVYGRADPLYNFKQTTRRISFGFKMPAASESEAYENLTKAQRLSQFMYPNYADIDGAKTVSQGPLLRLKIMNLLQSTAGTSVVEGESKLENLYTSYGEGGQGMLGFCSDVTFNFNLDGDSGVFQKSDGTILPKLIEVSIGSFNPIHEQHLGWNEEGFSDGSLFPYGAQHHSGQGSLGISYSESEQLKDEEARNEAAIANAEARYGGLFGDLRKKSDERRVAENDYKSDSQRDYIQSAQQGLDLIDLEGSDY
jgi:hypothetical protein